jgi:hypothetical protein
MMPVDVSSVFVGGVRESFQRFGWTWFVINSIANIFSSSSSRKDAVPCSIAER